MGVTGLEKEKIPPARRGNFASDGAKEEGGTSPPQPRDEEWTHSPNSLVKEIPDTRTAPKIHT